MRRAPVIRLSMIVAAALACTVAGAAGASAAVLGDGGSAGPGHAPGRHQHQGRPGPDRHHDGPGGGRQTHHDPRWRNHAGDRHPQWSHRDGDWSADAGPRRYSSTSDRAEWSGADTARRRPGVLPRSTADTRAAPTAPAATPSASAHRVRSESAGHLAHPHRTVIAPRPRTTAHVALAANTGGPHDASGPGLGSLARYGEIGAGLLVLLLAAGALALWRQDRGADG